MNFANLIFWSVTGVAGFLGAYKIEIAQRMVWRSQAKIVYEASTATWGYSKMQKE